MADPNPITYYFGRILELHKLGPNYRLLTERKSSRYAFLRARHTRAQSDSFCRINPGSSLHLASMLNQSKLPANVFDDTAARDLIAYPAEDALDKRARAVAPKLQKLTLPIIKLWSVVLPFQQQLHTICLVNKKFPNNFLNFLGSSPSTCRILGPKFQSLTIFDNKYDQWNGVNIEGIGSTLLRYGPQLTALKLDCLHTALTIEKPFLVFARLKTLALFFRDENATDFFIELMVPEIEWPQIVSLSLKPIIPIGGADQVLGLLTQTKDLRKLDIEICYNVNVEEEDRIKQYGKVIQMRLRDQSQAIKCKVEVLKISVQPSILMLDWEDMPDYSFFVDLYGGAFRKSLTKLIITLPCLVREDDYALRLKLNPKTYPKLETLILDYSLFAICDIAETDVLREQIETMCIQQIMFSSKLIEDNLPDSIASGIRRLNIKGLFKINQAILRNISQVFPNLVELNIQARESTIYLSLKDLHLLEMLRTLQKLRVLRFLDSFTKPDGLYRSIEFMCNRAKGLKDPKEPMVVRIPIDLQWKQNAMQRNMTVLDTISEGFKWIQVV